MFQLVKTEPKNRSARALSRCVPFKNDDMGTTAIEFGILALPFFMFVCGVLGIGVHFFTQSLLEDAVGEAARQIRTGQAQTSGMSVTDFKKLIVDRTGSTIDANNLRVHMQAADKWSDVSPRSCLDSNGQQTAGTGNPTDAVANYSGGAGAVVMVTVCYEWETAKYLPFLDLSQMANGSGMLQASTTFRTEPYQ